MEITEEIVKQIKHLLLEGVQKKDIEKIVKLSRCSLQRICIKHNIHKDTHKIIKCKQCNKELKLTIGSAQIYCNRRCAALFNNKLRITTEVTKHKRKETIKRLYDEGILIRKHKKI